MSFRGMEAKPRRCFVLTTSASPLSHTCALGIHEIPWQTFAPHGGKTPGATSGSVAFYASMWTKSSSPPMTPASRTPRAARAGSRDRPSSQWHGPRGGRGFSRPLHRHQRAGENPLIAHPDCGSLAQTLAGDAGIRMITAAYRSRTGAAEDWHWSRWLDQILTPFLRSLSSFPHNPTACSPTTATSASTVSSAGSFSVRPVAPDRPREDRITEQLMPSR